MIGRFERRPDANRWDKVSLGLFAGGALVTALLYTRLPPRLPVHFDVHAEPDGWLPRAVASWLMLAFGVGVTALVRFGSRLVPSTWRARVSASPEPLLGALVAGMCVALHLGILYAALHPGASLSAALYAPLGIFWLLSGLVMPRVRRNPFVGIRTTWALSSDENWARTHRVAGMWMAAAGAVTIVAGLAGAPVVALVAILTSALVPAVYSWRLARKLG